MNSIEKKVGLNFDLILFHHINDPLKFRLNKWKDQTIKFDKIIIKKKFFTNYSLYFLLKDLYATMASSTYFIISSFIFYLVELKTNDNDISEYLFHFWFKFYLLVILVLIFFRLWYASLLMK